jgi:ATP-dependent Clp protease ATP-binding subunit ClpC
MTLRVAGKAKEFLVDKGYSQEFGARNIRRTVEQYIENIISEEILSNNLSEGDAISLRANKTGDGLSLVRTKKKETAPRA